ncbi:MAG: magnesium transporter [Deltaproteobacteria bacterium]|nr:MAG: magnesium transporter [Deltaproteobacteria bacterium]
MTLRERNNVLLESTKRLLRRNAVAHLRKIVNKTHAADLSSLFRSLPFEQQIKLFEMIESQDQKGVLLSELDPEAFLNILENMEIPSLIQILDTMPSDDVRELINRLPEETADQILDQMNTEGSEEIEGLLRYSDDTAGAIMTTEYIAFQESITAREAMESLQKEYIDVEMPFYLYVVDEYQRLIGVCSLRQLVVNPPERQLKTFMSTDIVWVTTEMDQEEVARIVARYDILAVPVVDENNTLVGIVTVDDVIDVLREEATEDILKMAGVGEEFVETQTILRSTRIRLPWLFASCVGGIFAFFIVGKFEDTLIKVAYLAAFIPVIMGMGGNIGTQSSTIVVRGLATGRILVRDCWAVVGKELCVGLILGLFYGLLVGSVAQFRYDQIRVAVSVASAVLSSMSIAALVGSLVPMLFARINMDPAVATGPFVTTAIDIISIYCYFMIATTLLAL